MRMSLPDPKLLLRALTQKMWRPLHLWFSVRGPVALGRDFHLGPGSRVESSQGLTIGDDVYIGKYCSIVCDGEIGDDVLIANNVGLVGRNDHDHRAIGIGIRRAPWIGDANYQGPGRDRKLVIDPDVWIGFGAVVLSGVTVGRGAIVSSGSVVSSNVAPYDIVGGNPAVTIGRRFKTEEEIQQHERLLDKNRTEPARQTHSTSRAPLALARRIFR